VLKQYLDTQMQGVLHVEIFVAETDTTNFADIPVSFGITPSIEYIIPYRSESITEEMTNGLTHLRSAREGGPKIYFSSVRELFFGDTKAFLLCTPADSVTMPALLANGGEHGGDIP
jgi:adenine specific DNA methylase Mod